MPGMPPGVYWGKLEEIGEDALRTGRKTPFIYMIWDIVLRLEGEKWVPVDVPPGHHVRREIRLWCSPASEPFVYRRLAAIGWNGDLEHPEFNADPHPQRDGWPLRCRHRQAGPRIYENWDIIVEGAYEEGRQRVPWPEDMKRSFCQAYQAWLAGDRDIDAEAGKHAAPQPEEVADDALDTPGDS